MGTERKMSKLRKMINEGNIFEMYTQEGYFLKVQPALDIDKVKFAFVKKGSQGDGFDIYVDAMKFNRLCKDILSRMMEKKIAADNGDYPGAWEYRTGSNGNLIVAIGKGKKGIVVQGRNTDPNKKKNAFIPVSYEDLLIMADMWVMVSKDYFDELYGIFKGAMKNIAQYHNAGVEQEEYREPEGTSENTTPTEAPKNEAPAVPVEEDTPSIPSYTAGNEGSGEESENSASNANAGEVIMRLLSTTTLLPLNNDPNSFAMKAQGDDSIKKLVFMQSEIQKCDAEEWKRFEHCVNNGAISFNAVYVNKKDVYYFKKFAV